MSNRKSLSDFSTTPSFSKRPIIMVYPKRRAYKDQLFMAKMRRQIAINKPEMKQIIRSGSGSVTTGTAVVDDLNDIGASTDVNGRIGRKVRIHRMEILGTGSASVDHYIIKGTTTTAPQYTDTTAVIGGHLEDTENQEYYVYRHWLPKGTSSTVNPFRYTIRFPTGLYCKYNGPLVNNCISNKIYLVIANHDGSNHDYSYSVKVWFTDA